MIFERQISFSSETGGWLMNIAQAKEQIERAMKAYFTKDEFGDYKITVEKQRPVFLMGPPESGKRRSWNRLHRNLGLVWFPIR